MSGDHGDGQGHHSHGGSGGLGWNLLDTVVAAATTVLAGLLAEMLWRSWRVRQQGVRFNLTPQGRAATDAAVMTEPGCTHPLCKLEHPHAGPAVLREPYKPGPPRIDLDELAKDD